MDLSEIKQGDALVMVLDARCPAEFENLMTASNDIGRALATWSVNGTGRFIVLGIPNYGPDFKDVYMLQFRDAKELLQAIPNLAATSRGSNWYTCVMDDVEPQIHAELGHERWPRLFGQGYKWISDRALTGGTGP